MLLRIPLGPLGKHVLIYNLLGALDAYVTINGEIKLQKKKKHLQQ